MKKFLYGMMAATMMFATSCENELELGATGEESVVSFTIATPDMGSRAYSDGQSATQLQYAVYNSNGELLGDLTSAKRGIVTMQDRGATVKLPLVTGNSYKVIFWAAAPKAPYTVDFAEALANAKMTVNYTNAVSNDEKRDAFYKYHEFTVSGAQTETIELRRPFAQLNIGTNDYAASTSAGYTPTQSAVTVKQVYTKLNLMDGSIDENSKVDAVFAENLIDRNQDFPVDGYEYLAMNYVLVGTDKETVEVEFTYTDGTNAKTRTVGSVPVQRNYRTNIYGQLLTSDVDVNVEIKPEYDGANGISTVVFNNIELQAALDAATADTPTSIYLGCDIEGNVTVVQKQGVKITIEGGNNKFKGAIKVHSNSEFYADAALTIKDVNFETSTASVNFIEALENGSQRYSSNITVEGCTFTATGDAENTAVGVQIKASKNAKVIGCTAKNMHSLVQAQSCDETVLVQNCTVNGKNGVAFKQVKAATVEGTTITATGYGIRFDGNTDNYGITAKDINVKAVQPFIVRKMTGANNTIKLEGTNNLEATSKDGYQIVITKGSDDEEYVKPTGTYTLTGADEFKVYPAIESYDAFLAKISDDTWYDATKTELAIEDVADFAAFVETANSGNDFAGKTIKLTGDVDLYFKDITQYADGDPITFRPIGDTKYNGGKPFKGTFDGQGHTIKNLYQNGWDLGYQWGVYGSYGLFGSLENATVKNVVIEGTESYIEGGDVSFIAGSATGTCVFENITINSGVAATYNNGCGGIIGWSGAGNYTFKNITLGKDVVLGGLWGSFDSSIGGIVGQAEPGATYNFENVTINCRIDAYNDCTASYDYYNYRMCGMIIGRCEETTTINGTNYPDLSKYNLSFNNVVVNYGDWMNYHYCRRTGERAVRVEPGYSYDGAAGRDHSGDNKHCMECIPFDQLIGGDQYAVKGLREVAGVTVNYPASFNPNH